MEIFCKEGSASNDFNLISKQTNRNYIDLGTIHGVFECHKCKSGHVVVEEPSGQIKVLLKGEEF